MLAIKSSQLGVSSMQVVIFARNHAIFRIFKLLSFIMLDHLSSFCSLHRKWGVKNRSLNQRLRSIRHPGRHQGSVGEDGLSSRAQRLLSRLTWSPWFVFAFLWLASMMLRAFWPLARRQFHLNLNRGVAACGITKISFSWLMILSQEVAKWAGSLSPLSLLS